MEAIKVDAVKARFTVAGQNNLRLPALIGLGTGILCGAGAASATWAVATALAFQTVVAPSVGILLVVAIKPLVDVFWNHRVVSILSSPVNPQSLVGITVPLALAYVLALRRTPLPPRIIALPAIIYAVISGIGVVASPERGPAVGVWCRVALPLIFIWGGVYLRGARVSPLLVSGVLASYAVVPAASAILQWSGFITPTAAAVESTDVVTRVTGFYHHPLDIAMRCCIAFPFAFLLAKRIEYAWVRAAYVLFGFGLALIGCLTFVRSAIVATLLEVLALLWLTGRRMLAVSVLPVALVILAWVPGVRAVILEAWRPVASGDIGELATGRGALFVAQVSAYQAATIPQKVFGRGLHTIASVNVEFAPIPGLAMGGVEIDEGNLGAHNQFLRVLGESGLVGLIAFGLLVSGVIIVALKGLKESWSSGQRDIAIAVLSILPAMLVFSLTGNPFDLPSVSWPLWLVVGYASDYSPGDHARLGAT